MGGDRTRRIWIIDGHNVIFALPELSARQCSGDRSGARQRLEGWLEALAARTPVTILIVYDGNVLPRNPDVLEQPHLRSFFSQPPEEADDRIDFLARQSIARGAQVTVVTNDRRSLAVRLPREVQVLSVERFWQRHLVPATPEPERHPAGDFADVEAHFLARGAEIEERARRAGRRLAADAQRRWACRHPVPGSSAEDAEGCDPLPAPRRAPPRSGIPGVRPGIQEREPNRGSETQAAAAAAEAAARSRRERRARGQGKQERRLAWQKRARQGRSSRKRRGR